MQFQNNSLQHSTECINVTLKHLRDTDFNRSLRKIEIVTSFHTILYQSSASHLFSRPQKTFSFLKSLTHRILSLGFQSKSLNLTAVALTAPNDNYHFLDDQKTFNLLVHLSYIYLVSLHACFANSFLFFLQFSMYHVL